jgi:hypothetical protein
MMLDFPLMILEEMKMPLDTSRFAIGLFIVLVSLTARWLYAI